MKEIVRLFWKCISEAKYDDLFPLFNSDARIYFPNTREEFVNPHLYIEFNKAYPGSWISKIEKLIQQDQLVISTTKITSSDSLQGFYVTSYFEFSNRRIQKIEEYWGENSSPPDWRKDGKFTRIY